MIIRNAYVFTEKQTFEKQNIFIDGDRFVTAADSAEIVDGSGCYAIPGLIDSHFHGCMADLVLLERGTLALRRVFLAGKPVPVEKPTPAERPDGR